MVRIYVAVEDTYAEKAIPKLLRNLVNKQAYITVRAFSLCSHKMTRILRAALKDYDKVIILVDSEGKRPEDVEKEVVKKHLSGSKGYVIAVEPCIEEWPCRALGLKNCNTAPPDMGPIASIDQYWLKNHGKPYRKKYLPKLMEEAFHDIKPYDLRKISPTLRRFLSLLSGNNHL